jgi:hypothetical protein
MARITETQQALVQTIEEIQSRFDQLGLGGNRGGENEGDGVDPTDFITNPQPHVERIATSAAEGIVRESIAPLLSQMVAQNHSNVVESQRSRIDSEFGEGAWESHFAPELNPMFDRVRKDNPSQLGNADAIQRAVDAVKGAKFETLVEARNASATAREQSEEAKREEMLEIVRSNLTGGISRGGGKSVLTNEMKDFMEKEFRATGVKPDENAFLAAATSGSTLEDWQAAQAALKKK